MKSVEGDEGTPAGVGYEFYGSVLPAGFLWCDGASYLRSAYPDLFAAIGTIHGAVDELHFNVPDRREAAAVGVGTRAAGVATHDVFTLGQFKDDQMHGHAHEVDYQNSGGPGTGSGLMRGTVVSGTTPSKTFVKNPISDDANGAPRVGAVTRGKRLGVNFIIKT